MEAQVVRTMHPYGPHYHIGLSIGISIKRLRRCPDVVGKVGCAIGVIIRVEEGKRVYQDRRGRYRN